jgi:hypothetical protein
MTCAKLCWLFYVWNLCAQVARDANHVVTVILPNGRLKLFENARGKSEGQTSICNSAPIYRIESRLPICCVLFCYVLLA